jgi:hypothetical protein
MTDPIRRARALIDNPKSVADPLAEFERLRRMAPPEAQFMFPMLAEGLARPMNVDVVRGEAAGASDDAT